MAYVNIVMLGSIFLAMSLDFATLTLVKKVRNLQHENLPIQDINFPTKNFESPDLGSKIYHMYFLDLFYGKVKFGNLGFPMEKVKTVDFQKLLQPVT